eukprot:TRINITY_DN47187_c0_g1_i1.p1 TRINITY_DN47187_c0_g1~~TRINITY_DN47187_c0_g1_i1.p1  ORF type:complete len:266 (+),score=72.69 TRINITY_DN47187_c0_g1_i1:45-842(+)
MDDISFAVPWEGRLVKVPGRFPIPFKGCMPRDDAESRAAYWEWRHDCLMEEVKEGKEVQATKEKELVGLVEEMAEVVERYQDTANDVLSVKRVIDGNQASEIEKDEYIAALEAQGVEAIKKVAQCVQIPGSTSERKLQNELARTKRMLAAAEATAAESNEECDTLSEAVSRKDEIILESQKKERLHEKEKREWLKEKRHLEHTIRLLEADVKRLEESPTKPRTPAKRRLEQITNTVLSPSPGKKRAARPPPVPVDISSRLLDLEQ